MGSYTNLTTGCSSNSNSRLAASRLELSITAACGRLATDSKLAIPMSRMTANETPLMEPCVTNGMAIHNKARTVKLRSNNDNPELMPFKEDIRVCQMPPSLPLERIPSVQRL
ncbi:MAG: hypothetical protein ACD_34C00608G0001 [uncultured bacterium]|nr:MAG: hypothetical protein ACD_34C00608G0001 [uncultured bacterium]